MILNGKILDLIEKYRMNEIPEYLDTFLGGLDLYLHKELNDAFTELGEVTGLITPKDKTKPITLNKDLQKIFNYIDPSGSWTSKKTFKGRDILDIIESLISPDKKNVSTLQTSEEATEAEKPAQENDELYQVATQGIFGKKITHEKPKKKTTAKESKSAESSAEIKTSTDPFKTKETIQNILTGVSSNLAKYIDEKNNLNEKIKLLAGYSNGTDFLDEIKKIKEDIDLYFNSEESYVREYEKLYRNISDLTRGNKEETFETVIDVSTARAKTLIYHNLIGRFTNELTDNEGKNHHVIELDKNSPGKALSIIMLYLKSYFYGELKELVWNKLYAENIFASDKKEIEEYVFGTDSDAFDPEDIFYIVKPELKYLNKNASRSRLRVKWFGYSQAPENVTNNLAPLVKTLFKIIEERNNRTPIIRGILSLVLIMFIGVTGVGIKNLFFAPPPADRAAGDRPSDPGNVRVGVPAGTPDEIARRLAAEKARKDAAERDRNRRAHKAGGKVGNGGKVERDHTQQAGPIWE